MRKNWRAWKCFIEKILLHVFQLIFGYNITASLTFSNNLNERKIFVRNCLSSYTSRELIKVKRSKQRSMRHWYLSSEKYICNIIFHDVMIYFLHYSLHDFLTWYLSRHLVEFSSAFYSFHFPHHHNNPLPSSLFGTGPH